MKTEERTPTNEEKRAIAMFTFSMAIGVLVVAISGDKQEELKKEVNRINKEMEEKDFTDMNETDISDYVAEKTKELVESFK